MNRTESARAHVNLIKASGNRLSDLLSFELWGWKVKLFINHEPQLKTSYTTNKLDKNKKVFSTGTPSSKASLDLKLLITICDYYLLIREYLEFHKCKYTFCSVLSLLLRCARIFSIIRLEFGKLSSKFNKFKKLKAHFQNRNT